MDGYKQIKPVMVCRCRQCKTKLRTRWPETWHTHGWWCRVREDGSVRLYCPTCHKAMRKKTKRTTRVVAAKKGKRR